MVYRFILFAIIVVSVNSQRTVSDIRDSANTPIKVIEADELSFSEGLRGQKHKVSLKLFYESLCPGCIEFDPEFATVANKLHQYLDVKTYPYGNARMSKNADGSVTVKCQHGELECYGNKLHACAIDVLAEFTLYLDYNACMMKYRSNDTAAEKCGQEINLETGTVDIIKKCAKGAKGQELLIHYGQESEAVNFKYVPYVLLNEKEWKGEEEDLLRDVCAAFTNPPAPCPKTK